MSREGSIDWLCSPRFDSPARFGFALLGDRSNGRWLLAPAGGVQEVRRYQGDSLVLETEYWTDDGVVRVIDRMPLRSPGPDVARSWRDQGAGVDADATSPSASTTARSSPGCGTKTGRCTRSPGRTRSGCAPRSRCGARTGPPWLASPWPRASGHLFMLTWHASAPCRPCRIDPVQALGDTEAWWGEWASGIATRAAGRTR